MQRFRVLVWFALGIVLVLACKLSDVQAAAAGLTKIRIGYPSPSASMYPLFVTKEAGLFEKYGLDAELIYIQGVQMVQFHVAGQLDFTSTSGIVGLSYMDELEKSGFIKKVWQ